MIDRSPKRIPEWLSLADIARAWSEETGEPSEALEDKFRDWFKDYLLRNGYGQASADGDELVVPPELLEGRQVWRDTFETFCEERGHAKPRFWFPAALLGQSTDEAAKKLASEAVPLEEPSAAAAAEAAIEDKPKPPSRRREREGGAAFTRISLVLVLLVVVGLVALWLQGTGEPVAERERQPGAEQLAGLAPAVEQPPAASAPTETPETGVSAPAANAQTGTAALEPIASGGTGQVAQVPTAATQASESADPGLVLLVQRELQTAGFDPGPLDGRSGPKFSGAIAAYQRAHDLPVDGRVSVDLLSRLARENLKEGRTAPNLPAPGGAPDLRGIAGKDAGAPSRQVALQSPSTGTSSAPRGGSLLRGIQERLAARGYYNGPIDGSLGPKTREAIEVYQRAQRHETTGLPSRALFEELEDYALEARGLELFRRGDFDMAVAAYSRIITRKPKDADAYFNRGLAYKNAGRTEQALADYDAAIRLDPAHGRAHLNRANIRYDRGLYRDALRDYLNWIGL